MVPRENQILLRVIDRNRPGATSTPLGAPAVADLVEGIDQLLLAILAGPQTPERATRKGAPYWVAREFVLTPREARMGSWELLLELVQVGPTIANNVLRFSQSPAAEAINALLGIAGNAVTTIGGIAGLVLWVKSRGESAARHYELDARTQVGVDKLAAAAGAERHIEIVGAEGTLLLDGDVLNSIKSEAEPYDRFVVGQRAIIIDQSPDELEIRVASELYRLDINDGDLLAMLARDPPLLSGGRIDFSSAFTDPCHKLIHTSSVEAIYVKGRKIFPRN